MSNVFGTLEISAQRQRGLEPLAEEDGYGSIADGGIFLGAKGRRDGGASHAAHLVGVWQRVLGYAAVLLVGSLFFSRFLAFISPSSASGAGSQGPSPSPAPGAAGGPSCATYRYPQCEASILRYIASGARSRCAAFEAVKAEGDNLRFPYSESGEERCVAPGCCGCPGQCSRCPPLLAECSSWRVDGSWRVAFGDGTASNYNFDALGHVEMELPVNALPVVWKYFSHAYIGNGNDLPGVVVPSWLDMNASKTQCALDKACKGLTWNTADDNPLMAGRHSVYSKTVSNIVLAPGTGWNSLVQERHPELQHDTVAVAGPLELANETFRAGSDSGAAYFVFDLHRASPQLFPEDSKELISVVGGELRVQRMVPGNPTVSGEGVAVR